MKKLVLGLFSFILLLSGCSSSSDTFVYSVVNQVETLDTVDASYSQTLTLFSDVYLGIMKIDENATLVNGGSTNVDISEDGLTYTIELRDDVKWVDSTGAEVGLVTANDYVTAYMRMVDPAEGSVYSYIFDPVLNATDIAAGEKDVSELGVTAIDDYTLEIKLANPTPYFESMLAFGSYLPVATEAVEQYGDDYGTSAETTWYNGPYYVTEYDPDYIISIEKNELYPTADDVQIENISYRLNNDNSGRYNAFLNGEIDYAEISTPEDYTDAKNQGIVTDQLTGYSYYAVLNQAETAATSNDNLRQGLKYGFDREQLTEAAYGDIHNPIEYIIPSGMTGAAYEGVEYRDYTNDSLVTYDKAKADKYFDAYMEEMGYTDRSQITVRYLASADANGGNALAEVIQAFYLQEFGITIELLVQPFEQSVETRKAGGFDMSVSGWGPDYADPSTYLALWTTGQIGSQNSANYSNPEYDKLFEQANVEQDVDKRFTEFAQLEQMLVDDAVLVPMYQKNAPYVLTDGYSIPLHLFFKISHGYLTEE